MNEYGLVTEARTIRMERLLPGPIERVWDYLTDSTKRGKWFATGNMDLHPGGNIEFFFHHADLSAEKTRTRNPAEACVEQLLPAIPPAS